MILGPNHVVVERWRANHSNVPNRTSDPFNLAAMDRLADFNIKEARQQNKEFHELVRKFLCIFYCGLFSPLV